MSKVGRSALVGLAVAAVLIGPRPVRAAEAPAVRSEMVVSADWLAQHLLDVTVLHVGFGDSRTFAAGHIPTARHLPWSAIAVTRDGVDNELPSVEALTETFTQLGVGNTGRIVIYGDLGNLAAARAYVALDYLGHGDRVALLDGGLAAWRSRGLTLSTLDLTPRPAPFTPRPQPTVVVELDRVRELSRALVESRDASPKLVDARPTDEFTGATPGTGIRRPGHIPGAINLPWTDNLLSVEQPLFHSPDALRALWRRHGLDPDDALVIYCKTGGQASLNYFVAKYLGYDARLFDGSYMAWDQAGDTPVAGPDAAGGARHNGQR